MEILIPITLFIMIGAIVIAPRYFRSQERQKMAEALKAAIERGETVSPEMLASLNTVSPKLC